MGAQLVAGDRVVVLLSGGLDSAVVLAMALRLCQKADCMFVSYGQRHKAQEQKAAWSVVDHFMGEGFPVAATLHTAHVDLVGSTPNSALLAGGPSAPRDRTLDQMASGVAPTYVPARNLILLSLAASLAARVGANVVAFGGNADDAAGYPDCRGTFLSVAQSALMEGGANVKVWAPLVWKTKREVVELAREFKVPVDDTWSCYAPTETAAPCGRCDACILRRDALR